MGRSGENAGLLELPDNVPCNAGAPCALPSAQDLFKDYPSSFLSSLEQPLQDLSSRKTMDEDLCPLQHANEELKAEQSSLLLKNSELLSQTLLLKLENQRLKHQLELQLQEKKKQAGASLSISSSSLEESWSDSDDDEVKLMPVSSDDAYTTDDNS